MLDAVLGYKGNMASAKAARQVGEYNAKVAENEKILVQRATRQQEANLRKSDKCLHSHRQCLPINPCIVKMLDYFFLQVVWL